MPPTKRCERDALAVGLTRPALVLGIEKNLAFGNLILSATLSLNLQSPWPLLWGLLSHLFAFYRSWRDPLYFHLLYKTLLLTPPLPNFKFWGNTNSYGLGQMNGQ